MTLAVIFLIALLIGGNYTALKFALVHGTPMMITAFRTIVGGIFLMAFALATGERLPSRAYDFVSIFIVSVCITTISSMTLVMGVNKVPAGVGALLSSSMPLFTAFLAFLILRERLRGLALMGLMLGVVGATVLASPALAGETSAAGIGLLLIATTSWAMGTVMMKRRDVSRVSPVMFVAVQLFMSAAVLFPVALTFEGMGGMDFGVGLAVPLFYASVPAMAISFALMATIVRQAPAAQAASPAYLTPVFGVVLAFLIRGETLQLVEIAGGALVVLGVFLLSSANIRAPRATSPQASVAE
ncbi:MAG: drug/metabolite transporter (DMT)-like permease [Acidimicrobiales bacterium]